MQKMMKRNLLWMGLILLGVVACSKRVPLNKKEFTALLIDMHMADATLDVWQREGVDERRTYQFYNDLFKKYGLTKADFDSCVHYYTSRPTLFAKIYDVVIDTLNYRLTDKTRVWNLLTMRDSVNLFAGYRMQVLDTISNDSLVLEDKLAEGVWVERVVKQDTVQLSIHNPVIQIELDSITPGLYKFNATLQFEHKDKGKNNRIRSYFLSPEYDTLKVRDVRVFADSMRRNYTWTYYVADSSYTRLVIQLVECDNLKEVKPSRSGKIWGTGIFKQYTSPKQAARYERQYRVHKR